MSVQDKVSYFNKLRTSAKNSYFGKKLKAQVLSKGLSEPIKLGWLAPDFTSKTPEKKVVSLHEVTKKNKLTLVDFWGSWCVPCRKEIPNLKRVYEDFHAKGFEILAVAFEHKEESWIKALKEENMPWVQVSQIKGRDEEASLLFDVNGVPASLLIDGEGKIVAIDLPGSRIKSAGGSLRGEDLYKKVESILKQ